MNQLEDYDYNAILDDLQSETDRLLMLLKDRQIELFTWNEILVTRLHNICDIYNEHFNLQKENL